jgi:hypothetical protein
MFHRVPNHAVCQNGRTAGATWTTTSRTVSMRSRKIRRQSCRYGGAGAPRGGSGNDDHYAREAALGDARQAHRRLLIEAR